MSEEETTLAQVLSRGQIMSVSREPRRALTSVSVLVDYRLAPSFYFVAFYYHRGLPVANSLRVDVQAAACEGKVMRRGCVGRAKRKKRARPTLTAPDSRLCQLELNVDSHKDYRPGETVRLQLRTDSPALVALGAVDTALYAVGGRSHKPLDMGKVCKTLSPASLVLACCSFSCCPEP